MNPGPLSFTDKWQCCTMNDKWEKLEMIEHGFVSVISQLFRSNLWNNLNTSSFTPPFFFSEPISLIFFSIFFSIIFFNAHIHLLLFLLIVNFAQHYRAIWSGSSSNQRIGGLIHDGCIWPPFKSPFFFFPWATIWTLNNPQRHSHQCLKVCVFVCVF